MATKNFSDWRTEVAKYVKFQSTYNDTVDSEVKETIRDFCRDTGVWKKTLQRISTVADQATYTLTIPDTDGAAEVCYIDNVKYKEDGADDDQFRNLEPFTEEETDLYENGSWSFHESPDPYKFFSNASKQLLLYPIPTVASTSGLLVRVVVRPTDAATSVIDHIYIDYKKAIAVGCAAGLMNMPNKPWSNAEMGQFYQEQYLARRDEAYQNVKSGYTKAKQQVVIPWCGGSRSQRRRHY
jgi:hypothetical protein